MIVLMEAARLAAWGGMCFFGGVWIVRGAFRLRDNEEVLVGLGVGVALEIWLANLLGRFLPVPLAFWLAAGLVLAAGLALSLPLHSWKEATCLFRMRILPLQWLALVGMTLVLFAAGRGLAILDDYQNLPTTSMLAAGDIPPRFALDPNVTFDYHYYTLLFAAQVMRLGDLFPWSALDLVRAFALALSLLMGGLWMQRATRSALAGWLAVVFGAFNGGTRWLMLLLPEGILRRFSDHIQMIGSAGQSAPDFFTAMQGTWSVDAGSQWEFPFAYANGMNAPSIWTYHSGAGAMSGVLGTFILLTHNRWRGWRGGVVTAAVLAAWALVAETSLVRLLVGFGAVAVLFMALNRTWRVPRSLWRWGLVLLPVMAVAAVQGGVWSGLFSGLVGKISGAETGGGYFTFGFQLMWPPAFLSSHLGFLSLTNPYQLLTILFELGPMFFTLPLVILWGIKAFRARRWYEVALIVMPILSLFTLVFQYTGNAGPTAINRVQSHLIGITTGRFALAALWMWMERRKAWVRAAVASVLFVACYGGFVLFGIELLSATRPINSTFIQLLDARVAKDYWNRLEPEAVVFDPGSWRAVTVLGRPTNSHLTWYQEKPEWPQLVENPRPGVLRAAGFDYAYLDYAYWNQLTPEIQQTYENSCARLVAEYEYDRFPYDFRRLYDLKDCPAAP